MEESRLKPKPTTSTDKTNNKQSGSTSKVKDCKVQKSGEMMRII